MRSATASDTTITSIEQLRALYGEPRVSARHKVIDHIDEHVAAYISKSPFLLMATTAADGKLDVSPKGDPPGFIQVVDEKTLHFPDRPGNNRIDGMQNIVETGRIGLIFLIPGIRETLRINGTAEISIDPDLLASLAHDGKLPRSVVVITVEEVFMHCAKAMVRSRIWDPAAQIARESVPSMGTILAAHTGGLVDQCDYDSTLEGRLKTELY